MEKQVKRIQEEITMDLGDKIKGLFKKANNDSQLRQGLSKQSNKPSETASVSKPEPKTTTPSKALSEKPSIVARQP